MSAINEKEFVEVDESMCEEVHNCTGTRECEGKTYCRGCGNVQPDEHCEVTDTCDMRKSWIDGFMRKFTEMT